jgi:hypothetical protein
MGTEHTMWMIVAALAGGVAGALILIAAYFVGVALLGAGIGALTASLIWASFGSEPRTRCTPRPASTGSCWCGSRWGSPAWPCS